MTPRQRQHAKSAWDATKIVAFVSATLFAGQQWVSIRGEMTKQAAADSTRARNVERMRAEYATSIRIINQVPKLDRRVRRIERSLHLSIMDGPPMPSDTLEVRVSPGLLHGIVAGVTAPLRGLWHLIGGNR